MFNYYVPAPIYERLPKIYLALATVLALTPLGPIKWVPVAALLVLAMLTWSLRKKYREESRSRETASRRAA